MNRVDEARRVLQETEAQTDQQRAMLAQAEAQVLRDAKQHGEAFGVVTETGFVTLHEIADRVLQEFTPEVRGEGACVGLGFDRGKRGRHHHAGDSLWPEGVGCQNRNECRVDPAREADPHP